MFSSPQMGRQWHRPDWVTTVSRIWAESNHRTCCIYSDACQIDANMMLLFTQLIKPFYLNREFVGQLSRMKPSLYVDGLHIYFLMFWCLNIILWVSAEISIHVCKSHFPVAWWFLLQALIWTCVNPLSSAPWSLNSVCVIFKGAPLSPCLCPSGSIRLPVHLGEYKSWLDSWIHWYVELTWATDPQPKGQKVCWFF